MRKLISLFLFLFLAPLTILGGDEIIKGIIPTQLSTLRKHFSLEGNLVFLTDYRWRGISQTNREPAVQGSLTLSSKGFYSTIWGSYVNFPDIRNRIARSEIDFFIGHTYTIKDFYYDIGFARYMYPKAKGENYNELYLELGYTPVHFGLAYSNNVFDTGSHGLYLYGEVAKDIPLPNWLFCLGHFNAGFHVGHYNFGGSLKNFDYFDFEIFIRKIFLNHILFKLSFITTDGGFKAGKLGDPTLVATLSFMF